MNINIRVFLVVAIMLLSIATAGAGQAQLPAAAGEPFAVFEKVTHDYAVMHRRLESQIGPLTLGMSVDAINRNIRELAAAIRAERANAPQGEFFTPTLAGVLRDHANAALIEHGLTAADVLAESQVEGVDYRRVRLRVNDTFPWILGVGMLPCLLEALPPLPSELQYRIVARDLVLIDVHASLVVDTLPDFLAELTIRDDRPEHDSR